MIFSCFAEPQFNKDQPLFTHINSTHARLNLQGWTSGGCPITAVLLEFRPKGTWAWQSVRTNASADIFLAELREATWYELKMKTCNSAGCGNQSSQFATLDYDGSKFTSKKEFRFFSNSAIISQVTQFSFNNCSDVQIYFSPGPGHVITQHKRTCTISS